MPLEVIEIDRILGTCVSSLFWMRGLTWNEAKIHQTLKVRESDHLPTESKGPVPLNRAGNISSFWVSSHIVEYSADLGGPTEAPDCKDKW